MLTWARVHHWAIYTVVLYQMDPDVNGKRMLMVKHNVNGCQWMLMVIMAK